MRVRDTVVRLFHTNIQAHSHKCSTKSFVCRVSEREREREWMREREKSEEISEKVQIKEMILWKIGVVKQLI